MQSSVQRRVQILLASSDHNFKNACSFTFTKFPSSLVGSYYIIGFGRLQLSSCVISCIGELRAGMNMSCPINNGCLAAASLSEKMTPFDEVHTCDMDNLNAGWFSTLFFWDEHLPHVLEHYFR